jgi:hypothetical protein
MYLLVSVGVTLSLHFCGDSITSVQMLPFASKNDRCGCDDVTAPDDCCKTEIKSIQLNDDQLVAITVQPDSPQTDLTVWFDEPAVPVYASKTVSQVLIAESPPGSIPIYILQGSLLI